MFTALPRYVEAMATLSYAARQGMRTRISYPDQSHVAAVVLPAGSQQWLIAFPSKAADITEPRWYYASYNSREKFWWHAGSFDTYHEHTDRSRPKGSFQYFL